MTHSFPPRRSADLDRIGPAEPVARIRTAPGRRLAESPARFRATTVAETAPTGCRNQLSHQDQCPCAAGEPWNDTPRHRIGTEQSPQPGRASALGANPREALSEGRRDRDADPRQPGMPAAKTGRDHVCTPVPNSKLV